MSLAAGLSSEWLIVSEPTPHVLQVSLSRSPVNAFSTEQVGYSLGCISLTSSLRFWTAYGALFDRITRERRDVRALVVSSALPKLFSAGIDIKGGIVEETTGDAARSSLNTYNKLKEFQSAIGAPQRCPFPVIVAVHGLVVGLGIDLICACDVRYAADNSQFTIKEVDVGLAADIGTLAFLPKITGNHSLMHELAYTSRIFSATEALQLGLVSQVVPGGQKDVIGAALKLASTIATKSPIAVSGTKRILTHSRDHSVPQNLDYVAAWNAAALRTDDIPEGLRAAQARKQATFQPLSKPKL
ncbi:Delta-2 dienoyl-CoA isomerase [Mycena indigotica]|uniref:Delta-2 dienoyl-CoA isomerase n=1 Tax=Mycena indigotica TaxID=2126181 RepID=A0A8H6SQK0_9AGAR|nr:Delta-2 dienoyl-CoA isomerase [Mycena indigotica]KAF7303681.1 Delta-2 dienoyl-CoA isomerase [Mycena indigotica]